MIKVLAFQAPHSQLSDIYQVPLPYKTICWGALCFLTSYTAQSPQSSIILSSEVKKQKFRVVT